MVGPDLYAVGSVVAQVGQQPGVPDAVVGSPVQSVLSGALGSFLLTLLVGGLLMGIWPTYTRGRMDDIADQPLNTFLYGLGVILLLVVISAVLVVTVVGVLVAIPLLLFVSLVWIVGSAVAFLLVGHRIAGDGDGWFKPLLVGAAVNGGLALTGIGGLVSFCLGAAGFGAILRAW